MSDPNYTDGTEGYDFGPTNEAGEHVGWGPPPEAPHFETIDGVSQLCIDPPGEAWVTYHKSDGTSVTFLYYPHTDGFTFHGAPHECVETPLPECGTTLSVHATWGIGKGQSETLTHVAEACPAPAPVPEVPAPVPVELITAAVVEVPSAPAPTGPQLAATGPWSLGIELALAVVFIAAGRRLARLGRATQARGLTRGVR